MKIDPSRAVDLGDREYLERTKRELDAARTAEREKITVEEWERRMHRVFKGIATRRSRRQALMRVGKRLEAGTLRPRETHDRKPRNRGGGPYLRPKNLIENESFEEAESW